MFYNAGMSTGMDAIERLQDIATYMHLEPAEELRPGATPSPSTNQIAPCGQVIGPAAARPRPTSREAQQSRLGVFHAAVPGGKTLPMLKTMLTTACERNCHYCPFRAGRTYRRHTFKPEELAKAFMDMHRAGLVRGLFLSSGIIGGGVRTQDRLLDAAALLRHHYHFRGYLHLKIMPGAEQAQVERAMQLADRLSINLEAPNPRRLQPLAPQKQFEAELLQPLRWVEEVRQTQPARFGWDGRWPSTVTQFVVGAVQESDLEILTTTHFLMTKLHLRRTYYSAFSPVQDTPLENQAAEDPLREHRLYQASFLFRDYGFDLEEMPFTAAGNLPLDVDPKRGWAEINLKDDPVEVNRADQETLLRVPGIGPKSANTILTARRQGTLRSLHELQSIGIRTKGMEPYVLLNGRRPEYQLPLFNSPQK
jgi:predicted DNA-binding helix-hairpin-helix protein